MTIRKKPGEIWAEYEKGVSYNMQLGENGLYDAVEQQENFYIGRQWEGVNAPDLEKPVLNFTHRVVSYLISLLVADDIGVNLTPFKRSTEREAMCKLLSQEVERVVERSQLKPESRRALRNSAVDGDGCAWFYLDDRKTGEAARGEITCEIIENTRVQFGNPHEVHVEKQPYILLIRRRQVEEVRDLMKRAGQDPEGIEPDSDGRFGEEVKADDLVTCVTKLWKNDNGTVCWMEICKGGVIRKEQDTNYRRYPIAWIPWEEVRGCYHGHSAMEGMIPNQIFVNKLWAMMMEQVKKSAFPKVIYNSTLIKRWTNRVGDAIAVPGDVDKAIAQNLRGGDFSHQALELVEKTISYTKDYLGANDVALGNVNPQNTSAIIATQKASTAPLELQRLAYFRWMEDCVRIIIEIMRCDYGRRTVRMDLQIAQDLGFDVQAAAEMGADGIDVDLDFARLDPDEMELNVDVGTSSYWSEITQQQSADNLLKSGVLKDVTDYVERIPDKWIKDKQGLLQKLREQQKQMQQAQAVQGQNITQGLSTGGNVTMGG